MEQQLGQGHPGLFAPGENGDALINVVAGEEEPAEGVAEILVGLGGSGPAEFLEQGVARVQEFEYVLGIVGGYDVMARLSGAIEGYDVGQNFQQGRLSGPVGPDQRHPVPP